MTLRVCALGNSHIAAVQEAWKRDAARWPALDLHAYGLPGGHWDAMQVQDGALVPATPQVAKALRNVNGADQIALTGWDALVIAGMELSAFKAAATWKLAHCHQMSPGSGVMISAPAFRAFLRERLEATGAVQLARRLSTETDAPIYLMAQPRPDARAQREGKYHVLRTAALMGEGERLSQLFDEACIAICADLGFGLLPQPMQTREAGLFTASLWMEGSVPLAHGRRETHAEADLLHANPAYGALALDLMAHVLTDAE